MCALVLRLLRLSARHDDSLRAVGQLDGRRRCERELQRHVGREECGGVRDPGDEPGDGGERDVSSARVE